MIKGRYSGSVVVLDEPAPVDHEVELAVQFPREPSTGEAPAGDSRQRHWEQARARLRHLSVSVADEVIRQRHME